MATAKEIKDRAHVRLMQAGSLRLQGMTYAAIGLQMGVSLARARELAQKFDRNCQWTARYGGLKPHEYMELESVQDWLTVLAKDW
jgi:hypothetical protein